MSGQWFFFDDLLLFVSLINPVSKLLVVNILAQEQPFRRVIKLCIASTLMAAFILLSFAAAGKFLLVHFLHIHLHSLKVVGGAVLVASGFSALEKGRFLADIETKKLSEASIVPLASPLIAGPASITASISQASLVGFWRTASVLSVALAINLVVMLLAPYITRLLGRTGILGPLVRITGMIVMAIGVELALAGVGDWWLSVNAAAVAVHP
ncbi:MAG TPA: MarC family protein [Planctomycetes bacterium]|nr:MarC family protein [Planctomycetota bacterium]